MLCIVSNVFLPHFKFICSYFPHNNVVYLQLMTNNIPDLNDNKALSLSCFVKISDL
jgi:hypothetical protein